MDRGRREKSRRKGTERRDMVGMVGWGEGGDDTGWRGSGKTRET